MFTEATRSLIGYAILLVMAGAAVAALLYKNRSRIREILSGICQKTAKAMRLRKRRRTPHRTRTS